MRALYDFSAGDISKRILATFDQIVSNAEANQERVLWHEIESPRRLGEVRMAAMRRCLDDLPQGLEAGRYRAEVLRSLPFEDRAFDRALCSHFLFTFPNQLSKAFHVAAIEEMCRVSREARVFPLLESYAVHTKLVPYVFRRDGNRMLVAPHNPRGAAAPKVTGLT